MKARRSYTFYDYAFLVLGALIIAFGYLVSMAGIYSGDKWNQAKGKIISYVGAERSKDNVTRSTTTNSN